MFDVDIGELAVIAVVALIAIGPKDLPKVLKSMGVWTRKARLLAGEFQRGIDDMIRESELADIKKSVENIGNTDIRREVEKIADPDGEIAKALEVTEAPCPDLASISTAPPESFASPDEASPVVTPAPTLLPLTGMTPPQP
jgi:sec-independent protein translocase protein TatB